MDEKQRNQLIAEKLNQGMKLNDIQKLLENEHGIRMTYFDLRMLAAELDVDWSKHEPPPTEELEADDLADPTPQAAELVDEVRVTVNKLARPDAAISGAYECPSGAKGEWIVDHYGRPGMIPADNSPKPTPEEMKQFQEALVRELQGAGAM